VAGYGTATSPKELLEAMRDQAKQESTKLAYLSTVSVVLAIRLEQLANVGPTIFLVWRGSPEEKIGIGATSKVWRARHRVNVVCVKYTVTPHEEKVMLGTGHEIGLADFVADTLDFYGNNLLGLSGLEAGDRPIIEVPDNSVNIVPIDSAEQHFLATASLEYEAVTRPFERTGA